VDQRLGCRDRSDPAAPLKVRVAAVVCALGLAAALVLSSCEIGPDSSTTSTSSATPSVAVTASPSATPAPTPTPTPLPTPTPTAVPTPSSTLDSAASSDLRQISGLASQADDAELVRHFCPDLESTCTYVVNEASNATQQLPQAIQRLFDDYNLKPGISGLFLSELQKGLTDLQSGIDEELAGIADHSGSTVVGAAGQVQSGAFEIDGAVQGIQNSLP
jgi:hypothetical protein